MKKIRLLALVLVVGIALSGIGYALWTDNLVLNAMAKTGKLDIQWMVGDEGFKGPWGHSITSGAGASVTSQIGIGQSEDPYHHQHAKATAERVDDNTIEVTAENLYPGARFKVDMRAINVGTVPAKFAGIRIDRKTDGSDGDDTLFNNLKVYHMNWAIGNKNADGTMDYGSLTETKLIDPSWGVYKPIWLRDLPTLIQNDTESGIKDRVLEPDGKGVLLFDGEEDDECIVFEVNPEIDNTLMEKWTKFRLIIDFVQADVQ